MWASWTALVMAHDPPLFDFNFTTISYYANPAYVLTCPEPNAGPTLGPTSTGSDVCSPEFNAGGSPTGCSPYPPPPDFTGRIDHLGHDKHDYCVMECTGDSECSPTGASECHQFWNGPIPYAHKVCLHPGGGQGVYYSTGTWVASTPHVTVTGHYSEGYGVILRGSNYGTTTFGGYNIYGNVTIEMSVYVERVPDSVDDTSGLLVCESTSSEKLRLYYDSTTLYWKVNGTSAVSGRSNLHIGACCGTPNHIVITTKGETVTLTVNNEPLTGTGELPNVDYECTIGKGVDVGFSYLRIHDTALTDAEVHSAYGAFLASHSGTPAPAGESGESDGTSTLTVVALIATGVTLTASTVGMFALGVVSCIYL